MPGALVLAQATTDVITITNPLTFGAGTALTYCQWLRQRAAPAVSQGTSKGGSDLFVYEAVGGTWFMAIARATTASEARVTDASLFPDTNFCCICITYDETNGVKIYRGSLSTAMVEMSYFVARVVGAGNTSANTGNLWIGNRNTNLAPAHTIMSAALFPAVLTTVEMDSWRRRPRKTVNANVASTFGRGGKGGVNWVEYCGQTAVLTGCTQGDGPPLYQYETQQKPPQFLGASNG